MKDCAATVISNKAIAQDTYELILHEEYLANNLAPGQFLNLAPGGRSSELLRIPLSFAKANPASGETTLIYQVVGTGTQRLSALVPGAEIQVLGPLGKGWDIEGFAHASASRALLIAGGLGLVPIAALAQELSCHGIAFEVGIGAASKERLFGLELIETTNPIAIHIATDDGSAGHHGFCTDLVASSLERTDHPADYLAICGPKPMEDACMKLAYDYGRAGQVSLEVGMLCGFGVCMSCVIDTNAGRRGVCTDGPVFDIELFKGVHS